MIEKLIDILARIIDKITDPAILVMLLMIGILTYLLILERKAHDEIFTAIKDQTKGLAECNETLSAVLTLIEVVVYGTDDKGGTRG